MEKPFSFSSAREQAEKEFGLGRGEYLKLKEGNNTIRLMSPCVGYESEYKGKKNFKWVCWVIDRADNVIKPFFMPHSIYTDIEAYQMTPDYAFETVPMPYDVTITAKGAGTKEVKYTVTPARSNVPLTGAETEEFGKRIDIHEFVQKLKDKASDVPTVSDEQKQKERAEIEDGISVDSIPF